MTHVLWPILYFKLNGVSYTTIMAGPVRSGSWAALRVGVLMQWWCAHSDCDCPKQGHNLLTFSLSAIHFKVGGNWTICPPYSTTFSKKDREEIDKNKRPNHQYLQKSRFHSRPADGKTIQPEVLNTLHVQTVGAAGPAKENANECGLKGHVVHVTFDICST